MVEHLVRALLEDERAAAVGAGRGEHAHAQRAGDLDRGDADAAAAAVDEDGLAGLRAGAVDDRRYAVA